MLSADTGVPRHYWDHVTPSKLRFSPKPAEIPEQTAGLQSRTGPSFRAQVCVPGDATGLASQGSPQPDEVTEGQAGGEEEEGG